MSGISAPETWQADPANVKRLGVVARGVFFVVEHRDPRGVPLAILHSEHLYSTDPAEIAGIAFTHKCGTVWLLDSGYRLWFDEDDPAYTWHNLTADGAVCGLVVQVRGDDGKGHGLPLMIADPHVNDAWGIAAFLVPSMDVQTFASGIALAAFALGQQLRFSPSYTGNAIMRRVLADYEQHTGKMIPQLSPLMREFLYEHRPSPIQRRFTPLVACGDEDITIHVYDRNWSYVSSAGEVPVGDPIETTEFHRGCPGLYLVLDLLHPDNRRWVWEPELRGIIDNDPDTDLWEVVEGYYWPKDRKIDLRIWRDRMWGKPKENPPRTGRRAVHAVDSVAGRIAEAIIKKAGVAAIGRLIQRRGRKVCSEAEAIRDGLRILNYETDDTGRDTGNVEVEAPLGREDMAWPHVWSTIISNADERITSAIVKYAPLDTKLAYVDQIYTTKEHPELCGDPMKAGGWKHACSFRVPAADVERLNTMDAQALVKAFAAYQRQQGMRGVVPVVEVEYGE